MSLTGLVAEEKKKKKKTGNKSDVMAIDGIINDDKV